MNEDGHLVTILSEEENLFVVSIAQFSPMYSDTWIGATDGRAGSDQTGPGTYTWVTGETWNYDAWAGREPDGACDPCSGGGLGPAPAITAARWSATPPGPIAGGNPRGYVCEATP